MSLSDLLSPNRFSGPIPAPPRNPLPDEDELEFLDRLRRFGLGYAAPRALEGLSGIGIGAGNIARAGTTAVGELNPEFTRDILLPLLGRAVPAAETIQERVIEPALDLSRDIPGGLGTLAIKSGFEPERLFTALSDAGVSEDDDTLTALRKVGRYYYENESIPFLTGLLETLPFLASPRALFKALPRPSSLLPVTRLGRPSGIEAVLGESGARDPTLRRLFQFATEEPGARVAAEPSLFQPIAARIADLSSPDVLPPQVRRMLAEETGAARVSGGGGDVGGGAEAARERALVDEFEKTAQTAPEGTIPDSGRLGAEAHLQAPSESIARGGTPPPTLNSFDEVIIPHLHDTLRDLRSLAQNHPRELKELAEHLGITGEATLLDVGKADTVAAAEARHSQVILERLNVLRAQARAIGESVLPPHLSGQREWAAANFARDISRNTVPRDEIAAKYRGLQRAHERHVEIALGDEELRAAVTDEAMKSYPRLQKRWGVELRLAREAVEDAAAEAERKSTLAGQLTRPPTAQEAPVTEAETGGIRIRSRRKGRPEPEAGTEVVEEQAGAVRPPVTPTEGRVVSALALRDQGLPITRQELRDIHQGVKFRQSQSADGTWHYTAILQNGKEVFGSGPTKSMAAADIHKKLVGAGTVSPITRTPITEPEAGTNISTREAVAKAGAGLNAGDSIELPPPIPHIITLSPNEVGEINALEARLAHGGIKSLSTEELGRYNVLRGKRGQATTDKILASEEKKPPKPDSGSVPPATRTTKAEPVSVPDIIKPSSNAPSQRAGYRDISVDGDLYLVGQYIPRAEAVKQIRAGRFHNEGLEGTIDTGGGAATPPPPPPKPPSTPPPTPPPAEAGSVGSELPEAAPSKIANTKSAVRPVKPRSTTGAAAQETVPVYNEPAQAAAPATPPKRSADRADRISKQKQTLLDLLRPKNNVIPRSEVPSSGAAPPPPSEPPPPPPAATLPGAGAGRRGKAPPPSKPPEPPTAPPPPNLSGGPATWPAELDELRKSLKFGTADESLVKGAIYDSMRLDDPMKPWHGWWNQHVWSMINPSAAYHPKLKYPILSSGYYMDQQFTRIAQIRTGMAEILKGTFGTITDKPIDWLKEAYIGPTPRSTSLRNVVGTLRDAIERSDLYTLSSLQKEAAELWGSTLDAELAFSRRLGIDVGEVEGVWVSHSVRSQAGGLKRGLGVAHPNPIQGRSLYSRGMFKERKLDLERYGRAIDEYNAVNPGDLIEIDPDLMAILSRRLSATAHARAEALFVQTAATNSRGRLLIGKKTSKLGERTVVARLGQEAQRWAFPEDIAHHVQSVLNGHTITPGENAAVGILENISGTILNADASVAGLRQALLAVKLNPVDALRGYGEAIQMWNNPRYRALWLARNWDRLATWQRHGLQLTVTPTDVARPMEFAEKHILIDRLPVVGAVNEFSFDVLMPILKTIRAEHNLDLLEAMRTGKTTGFMSKGEELLAGMPLLKKATARFGKDIADLTDEEMLRAAADGANNWLGGLDWTKVGTRSTARMLSSRVMLLTEGWMRTQLNTMRNAALLTPEGALARRALMADLVTTSALSSALSYALTGDLPEFDPRSSHWLDVKTPWGYVSLSPNKVLYRTLVRMALGPDPESTARRLDPFAERFNAIWGWFEGKQGPLLRVQRELQEGETFIGKKLPEDAAGRAAYVLKQFTPIVTQQLDRELADGTMLEGGVQRVLIEYAGGTVVPYSQYEQNTGKAGKKPAGLAEYNNAGSIVADALSRGDKNTKDNLRRYLELKDKQAPTDNERSFVQTFRTNNYELTTTANSELTRFRDNLAANSRDLLVHIRTQRGDRLNFDPEQFLVKQSTIYPIPKGSSAHWSEQVVHSYLSQFYGKKWGIDGGNDNKVAWGELTPAARLELTEFLTRLDNKTVEVYNKKGYTEWRSLPSDAKTAIMRSVAKSAPPKDPNRRQ